MRDKIIRFMYGRYGVDELGKHMLTMAVVLSVIGMVLNIFRLHYIPFICSVTSIGVIAVIIYRAFSKNINRRVLENHKYLAKTEKVRAKIRFERVRFADRKSFRYVKCPNCKNYSRVPRGKGKIKITCRVCKKQFDKKV